MESTQTIYLCPRCLAASAQPGVCDRCGEERLGCRPGEADDPCRRPLMDARGQVRTRAPLWWVRKTMARLAEAIEQGDRPGTH